MLTREEAQRRFQPEAGEVNYPPILLLCSPDQGNKQNLEVIHFL